MKTIEYLNTNGVQKLSEELGIIAKHYPEHNLYILNYSQIDSPKTHPVVKECRGLIVEQTGSSFTIVSRSFDRFLNLNEGDVTAESLDFSKLHCYEKVDGSLLKIYWWGGEWRVSTRGTAFAESECNGYNLTFKDLVFRALMVTTDEEFQALCGKYFNQMWTYIFEITCRENRIVKHYEGYTLHFLATRHNGDGGYVLSDEVPDTWADGLGVRKIRKYSFDSARHCEISASNLPDLEEGYVLYNEDNYPVCKVKSPKYVAIHRLRGNGLNPKRIVELICLNEQDEYLSYYPEDAEIVKGYEREMLGKLWAMVNLYETVKDIEGQKEFALEVAGYPYSAFLFSARKNGTSPLKEYNKQPAEAKARFWKKCKVGEFE